jgi:hypothetical protein
MDVIIITQLILETYAGFEKRVIGLFALILAAFSIFHFPNGIIPVNGPALVKVQ